MRRFHKEEEISLRRSTWMRLFVITVVMVIGVSSLGLANVPAQMQWQPADGGFPNVARNGMVIAADPLAAQAGIEVMRQGGNAIDAAVATAAALGVVQPYFSGLFGSGYAVIYTAKDRTVRVADYNGEAPSAATP